MNDMSKLYDRGSEKINSELNLVKLIKNLRNVVFIVDNHFKNDAMEFKAIFDHKNIIDVDNTNYKLESDSDDISEQETPDGPSSIKIKSNSKSPSH
jgi:hypothetical protein